MHTPGGAAPHPESSVGKHPILAGQPDPLRTSHPKIKRSPRSSSSATVGTVAAEVAAETAVTVTVGRAVDVGIWVIKTTGGFFSVGVGTTGLAMPGLMSWRRWMRAGAAVVRAARTTREKGVKSFIFV
jgi:hypothetical protein